MVGNPLSGLGSAAPSLGARKHATRKTRLGEARFISSFNPSVPFFVLAMLFKHSSIVEAYTTLGLEEVMLILVHRLFIR